jgi:hypothetical protein
VEEKRKHLNQIFTNSSNIALLTNTGFNGAPGIRMEIAPILAAAGIQIGIWFRDNT